MHFFKFLVRSLASLLFIFLLSTAAITTGLVITFKSPDKIEKSLSDSGVYATFVSNALAEAQKANQKSDLSSSDLPIEDPAIVAAANKAFPPQLLQTSTENVLNGTYDWLSGKTEVPNFTIDLSQAKQTFAQEVGAAAKNRLKSLPICTAKQLKALGNNADIDAFTVTCRPTGINLDKEQQKLTQKLATSKDFLGTPKITPQNLDKNDNGQTIFDKAAMAPEIYKLASASPWIIAFLTLLIGTVIVFLYRPRRRGIKTVAIILTVVGALTVLGNISSVQAFNRLSEPNGKLSTTINSSFRTTIIKALSSVFHSLEQILLIIGIVYLVLGIVTLIALIFIKPKVKTESKKTDERLVTEKEAVKPAPAPNAAKPAAKPKRIQG